MVCQSQSFETLKLCDFPVAPTETKSMMVATAPEMKLAKLKKLRRMKLRMTRFLLMSETLRVGKKKPVQSSM